MSISSNITTGTTGDGTPDTGDGAGIDKQTLAEDQAVVVFSVGTFNPAAENRHRVTADVTADLLVVTGRHAGRRDRQWREWGNLAKQMGAQPAGVTVVGRVTSGPGSTPGSRWYGIDFRSITDVEVAAARAMVADVLARDALLDAEARTRAAAQPVAQPVAQPAAAPVAASRPLVEIGDRPLDTPF